MSVRENWPKISMAEKVMWSTGTIAGVGAAALVGIGTAAGEAVERTGVDKQFAAANAIEVEKRFDVAALGTIAVGTTIVAISMPLAMLNQNARRRQEDEYYRLVANSGTLY